MFLEIVSPEKTLFTGDVSSVQLPGSEGSFQILNNHAPIVSTLKKGEMGTIFCTGSMVYPSLMAANKLYIDQKIEISQK